MYIRNYVQIHSYFAVYNLIHQHYYINVVEKRNINIMNSFMHVVVSILCHLYKRSLYVHIGIHSIFLSFNEAKITFNRKIYYTSVHLNILFHVNYTSTRSSLRRCEHTKYFINKVMLFNIWKNKSSCILCISCGDLRKLKYFFTNRFIFINLIM